MTAMVMAVALAASAPTDYTGAKPEDYKLAWVEPKKDAKTGFVVGGKNPTAVLEKLATINGVAVADLEKAMRPGKDSTAGFLGKDEKLLDVLAADNDYVVGELGLTHQDIARPLRLLAAIGEREEGEFTYRGARLKVKRYYTRGYQDSPFKDGTKASSEAAIVNLDTGKEVRYSLLVPDMIERYGFYEGKGTSYRVDPRKVIEVLPFLKPKR